MKSFQTYIFSANFHISLFWIIETIFVSSFVHKLLCSGDGWVVYILIWSPFTPSGELNCILNIQLPVLLFAFSEKTQVMVKQTKKKKQKHMQINPETRYIQTANPLSWAGLTRPKVVPARHAAFPQQVFDC